MTGEEKNKIKNKMEKELAELPIAKLSNGYYYNSIALCIIDCVYSIGANYEKQCKPSVERFAKGRIKNLYYSPGSEPTDEYTLDDFIRDILNNNNDGLFGAETLYNNKRPASSSNGALLRSEVIYKIACYLRSHNINKIVDFRKVMVNKVLIDQIENDWVNNRIFDGQTEVGYSYFLMLCGDDNMMKIDRWILRFVGDALGIPDYDIKHPSISSIRKDLIDILKIYNSNKGLSVTPRLLDHTIWEYYRNRNL